MTTSTDSEILHVRASRHWLVWLSVRMLTLPLLAGVGGLVLSLYTRPPMSWFLQLVGTLGLWLVAAEVQGLLRYVAEFVLVDDELHVRRIGRRKLESLLLADVTDVFALERAPGSIRLYIRSHDAYSLVFDSTCLSNISDLAQTLANRPPPVLDPEARFAGSLDAGQQEVEFAMRSVLRTVYFGLILAGVFLAGISLARMKLFPGLWVLIPLGVTLFLLGTVGLVTLERSNRGRVIWFECLKDRLRLRVKFDRKQREFPLADLEKLERQRRTRRESRTWREGRNDWVYRMSMRGQKPLVLDDGDLSNLGALVDRLADQLAQSRPLARVTRPAPSSEDFERLDRLAPFLDNEQVLWVGQPTPGYFRSTIWGQRLGGLMLFAISAGLTLPILWLALARNETRPLLIGIPVLFLIAWGMGHWAAARRCLQAVEQTLYAVTDRRAMIVGGLITNPLDSYGELAGGQVTSFDPMQVLDYEARLRERAVLLGGFWQADRRGRLVFRGIGFIGCADPRAIQALDWLLDSQGLLARRIPFTPV